jgi:hypothetical protein
MWPLAFLPIFFHMNETIGQSSFTSLIIPNQPTNTSGIFHNGETKRPAHDALASLSLCSELVLYLPERAGDLTKL